RSIPIARRISVVLPAPFSPTRATISPGSTRNVKPATHAPPRNLKLTSVKSSTCLTAQHIRGVTQTIVEGALPTTRRPSSEVLSSEIVSVAVTRTQVTATLDAFGTSPHWPLICGAFPHCLCHQQIERVGHQQDLLGGKCRNKVMSLAPARSAIRAVLVASYLGSANDFQAALLNASCVRPHRSIHFMLVANIAKARRCQKSCRL